MFRVQPLPRKLSALQRDIKNEDVRVRLDVLDDLRRSWGAEEEREARLALIADCLDDEVAEVRARALLAICDYQGRDCLARVATRLTDPEIRVRQMALVALGELGQGQAEVERVRPFLRAQDASLRYQALVALAQLQAEQARDEILEGCEDSDAEVAALSVRLLGEVSEPGWEELPQVQSAIRRAAEHQALRVRVAAQLLGHDFRLAVPRDEVFALVRGRVRAPEVTDELWAIELAGRRGWVELIPALRVRAFGRWGISFDPHRYVAMASLVALGEEKARERLTAQLRSNKIVNRHAALEAILQLELASMVEPMLLALQQGIDFEAALLEKFHQFAKLNR